MKQLYIESYRPYEKPDGLAPRPAWIHVNDGTHETGASVLVDHCDDEFANVVADAIVAVLPDATRAIFLARQAQGDAEDREKKSHSRSRRAEAQLDAVLHRGRPRVFGEALVRTFKDGSAWLLDPVKQEAGLGLRFSSLKELWQEFPELRPVRWSGGDLIVSAFNLVPQTKPEQ